MVFHAKLPTFNSSISYWRLNSSGVWVLDAAEIDCQVYTPSRAWQLTWIDEFNTTRGAAGTKNWQTSQYVMFFLVEKTAPVRDPIDVRVASGKAFGARDYIGYSNANLGPDRTYWVDQVEPRWAGFPNEHKIICGTRRGYNP